MSAIHRSRRLCISRLFAIVGLAAAFMRLGVVPAHPHDVYFNLRNDLTPTGRLCCGGDPVTGDCEAVSYEMQPNGDAVFTSRRYGRKVLVGKDHITWAAVPGGEAFEAHWCGKPRDKLMYSPGEVNADQPDTETWTYCAFIAPGGV
jgi:hypothetical protein